MKTREEVQKDMLRRINEFQAKSMAEDAKLILMLAEATRLILAVGQELQNRHKYDLYPTMDITEEQDK